MTFNHTHTHTHTDLELYQKIKADKDREAFDVLYTRYYKALFYFVSTRLNSREDAEDVVQDIFMKIWKGELGKNGVNNLKGYLYGSVINNSDNLYAKRRRRSEIRSKNYFTEIPLIINLEKDLENKEFINIIYGIINEMFPLHRAEAIKEKIEGGKGREIAEKKGLSQSRISTDLGILRKVLNSISWL